MLSPLGGEFKGKLAGGATSCKPQEPAGKVWPKPCRQPGHIGQRGGVGREAGRNSTGSESMASYFLEIQPQASHCPLSGGTRLPGQKGHIQAEAGEGWCQSPGRALPFQGVPIRAGLIPWSYCLITHLLGP